MPSPVENNFAFDLSCHFYSITEQREKPFWFQRFRRIYDCETT
jgi:hypothetical protein